MPSVRSRGFFIFMCTLVSRAINFTNVCLLLVQITACGFYFAQRPNCLKFWLFFIVLAVRETPAPNKAQNNFYRGSVIFFYCARRVVNLFFSNKLKFSLIGIKRFYPQVFHAELERSVATLESADVASPSETIAIPNEKSWVLENKLADINERYSRWGWDLFADSRFSRSSRGG